MFSRRAVRNYFDRGILGMSPALLAATVIVGFAAGAIGALYLLGIHLLQHLLWPDNVSNAAEFAVLGAAGVAVVVIGRVLGSPGDVELLVDNIHVSGAASNVRSLRSLIPMSLLTISAGG